MGNHQQQHLNPISWKRAVTQYKMPKLFTYFPNDKQTPVDIFPKDYKLRQNEFQLNGSKDKKKETRIFIKGIQVQLK